MAGESDKLPTARAKPKSAGGRLRHATIDARDWLRTRPTWLRRGVLAVVIGVSLGVAVAWLNPVAVRASTYELVQAVKTKARLLRSRIHELREAERLKRQQALEKQMLVEDAMERPTHRDSRDSHEPALTGAGSGVEWCSTYRRPMRAADCRRLDGRDRQRAHR